MPSPEHIPEVIQNVFEDKMFDFFMNQETAVHPIGKDPTTLLLSSSSNLSPSITEESDRPETDPMLSTMKANLSKVGQLMDILAVRARTVSDSEVQNLRNVTPSLKLPPRDQLPTKIINQPQPSGAVETVQPQSVLTNATSQSQSKEAASDISSQPSAPAPASDLRQTTSLLVDLVKRS